MRIRYTPDNLTIEGLLARITSATWLLLDPDSGQYYLYRLALKRRYLVPPSLVVEAVRLGLVERAESKHVVTRADGSKTARMIDYHATKLGRSVADGHTSLEDVQRWAGGAPVETSN